MEGNHDLSSHKNLNGIFGLAMGYYTMAKAQEEQMCEEFKRRADNCIDKYWEACKYPRKTKKRMRKEAEKDYQLYMLLARPVLFEF